MTNNIQTFGSRNKHQIDIGKFFIISLALLLPYVSYEPAPVDIVLVLFTIYIILVERVHFLATVIFFIYIFCTLISSYIGLYTGSTSEDRILKYFLVEFYLALSLIGIATITKNYTNFTNLFIKWYIIGATISSLIVLVIKFGPDNLSFIYRDEFRIRVKGFFKDPNVLAPYLVLPIICCTFSNNVISSNIYRIMIIIINGSLLFLTYSRGGYASLAISLIFAFTLVGIFRNKSSINYSFTFILICMFISILYLLGNGFIERTDFFLSRFELKEYDSSRFFHIRNAIEIGLTNPFGIGPGSYGSSYGLNPHNLFAGKIVDAGIFPALIIFLLPIIGFFGLSYKYYKTEDNISLILAATMLAHIIASAVVYAHHWRHFLILSVISCIYIYKDRKSYS